MKLATTQPLGWGGGRRLVSAIVIILLPVCAAAADLLFPRPLHLTRRIDDPLSDRPIIVEEYCENERVVTVRGERVVIADYGAQKVTEIDRSAGTYSVTSFEAIASASPVVPQTQRTPAARDLGIRESTSGRAVHRFEAATSAVRMELGVDDSYELSAAAVEVLMGIAYPSVGSPLQTSLVTAAATSLPVEYVVTSTEGGETMTFRSEVTRVGDERAPPGTTAIPAGAKRVDSYFTTRKRAVD